MPKVQITQPQQPKVPTVVFCLPGRSFSGEFLKAWSNLIQVCIQSGIRPILSQTYDPVVYYVRNKCLGGDVLRGKNQKPFNGEIDYDYMMWIDSDIIFTPEQVGALLKRDLPIVAGVYKMSDDTHYAVVKDWDVEYFKKSGSFQFLTPADVEGQDLVEVDYSGFGFMLVKRGVFESLEYPWFRPIMHDLGNGVMDFSSEDVSVCKMLKAVGHKIYIDPAVRVGHEKMRVL